MNRRIFVSMLFIGVLLWTHASISATYTDNASNNTFSFTGTTVSTSCYLSGRGTPFYQVTGSADISGKADPLGDDTEYEATMWLEASGKSSGSIPGRGNINTNKKSGSILFTKMSIAIVVERFVTKGISSLRWPEAHLIPARRKRG